MIITDFVWSKTQNQNNGIHKGNEETSFTYSINNTKDVL